MVLSSSRSCCYACPSPLMTHSADEGSIALFCHDCDDFCLCPLSGRLDDFSSGTMFVAMRRTLDIVGAPEQLNCIHMEVATGEGVCACERDRDRYWAAVPDARFTSSRGLICACTVA